MEIKGVSYDVGRVMAGNWRPDFDPKLQRGADLRAGYHPAGDGGQDGLGAGAGSVALARDVG